MRTEPVRPDQPLSRAVGMSVAELKALLRASAEAAKVQRTYPGAPGEIGRAFAYALPHPSPPQRMHARHRLRRLGASIEVAERTWRELAEVRREAAA